MQHKEYFVFVFRITWNTQTRCYALCVFLRCKKVLHKVAAWLWRANQIRQLSEIFQKYSLELVKDTISVF
jgi:hypothetical protein